MWCGSCQQDVPAMRNADRSRARCCARCRQPFDPSQARPGPPAPSSQISRDASTKVDTSTLARTSRLSQSSRSPGGSLASAPTSLFDGQLESDLQAASQLIRSLGAGTVPPLHARLSALGYSKMAGQEYQAADPRHGAVRNSASVDRGNHRTSDVLQRPIRLPSQDRLNTAGWISRACLAIGTMTFVCGSTLLISSVFGNREGLWSVGLPILVVGQGGLLLAFILQRDIGDDAGRTSNAARSELDPRHLVIREAEEPEVDFREVDAPPVTAPASIWRDHRFRADTMHGATEASPHAMLAELQQRVDRLADRLEQI